MGQQQQNIGSSRYMYLGDVILGKGAYGSVRKALDTASNTWVAIKTIPHDEDGLHEYKLISREIKCLEKASGCKNVVGLKDVYRCAKGVQLVLEYMQTDLKSALRAGRFFNVVEIACIAYQLFSALKHIHARRILHRDVKMSNILISRDNDDGEIVVKLADFGLARFKRPCWLSCRPLEQYVGTPGYRAPEVYTGRYGRSADIWSAGIVIAELCLGTAASSCGLLRRLEDVELDSEGLSDCVATVLFRVENEFSPLWADLLSQLLVEDASRRLTAATAMMHPVFDHCRSYTGGKS